MSTDGRESVEAHEPPGAGVARFLAQYRSTPDCRSMSRAERPRQIDALLKAMVPCLRRAAFTTEWSRPTGITSVAVDLMPARFSKFERGTPVQVAVE